MAPTLIPLEECVAVLARVAAEGATPTDERASHLHAVQLIDWLAAHGMASAPERILPLLAASTPEPERAIVDLLLRLLDGSAGFAEAVIAALRARVAALEAPGNDEAALAHAVRAIVLVPAREIGAYLPREVVLANDFRREELVRAYAAVIGAVIEARGAPEPAERSARVLERLDYRRIREDEVRLAVEQRVLAVHAERIREAQRKREAEALASAQRE